jgi:heme exporter protein B
MTLSVSTQKQISPSVEPARVPSPVRMRTGGGPAAFARKVWAVMAKDLRAELRAKESLSVMIAFSLLAILVFGLAFDLRVPESAMVVPGVVWVVILYSGVLGLNRTFGAEVDRGTLAALLLAPVDRSAIYFGKLLGHLSFMLLNAAIVLPFALVLFDTNLLQPWILVGVLLGTVGYTAVGTLFAALAASSRARDSLLPILLLPVMIPIFMAGIAITAAVLDGDSVGDFQRWLWVMVVYDLLFLTVSYLVFDLIWEEV